MTNATIVAGITGPLSNPDFVWWFGTNPTTGKHLNPSPANYPTTAALTLPGMPANSGPYYWTITAGANEMEFPNKTQLQMTMDPTITVDATAPSPPNPGGVIDDITIAVYTPPVNWLSNYGYNNPFAYGMQYAPFRMRVRRPYETTPMPMDSNCIGYAARNPKYPNVTGYSCLIYYTTNDQFGVLMPTANLSINENWPPPAPPLGAPYTNWNSNDPAPCGATGHCLPVPPALWADQMAYPNPPNSVPPAILQENPLTALILQTSGGWWFGADTPGVGIEVQTNDWLIYQGSGAHGSFNSPPAQ